MHAVFHHAVPNEQEYDQESLHRLFSLACSKSRRYLLEDFVVLFAAWLIARSVDVLSLDVVLQQALLEHLAVFLRTVQVVKDLLESSTGISLPNMGVLVIAEEDEESVVGDEAGL